MLNLHTLLKLNILFWGHGFEPQTDHGIVKPSTKTGSGDGSMIEPICLQSFASIPNNRSTSRYF